MPWSYPLLAAAQYKCPETVQELLLSGVNPDGPNADIITPLEIAVENDDLVSVVALIENRASVNHQNQYGETALHIAAFEYTSFEVFETLLHANADINIKDHSDKTPLHLACYEFDLNKVKAILKYSDPPVNAKDDEGATPVHLLVYSHDDQSVLVNLIQLAQDKGFDVNSQTDAGETILHTGSQHMYCDTLLPDLLQLDGVDIALQDKTGDNFLHSFFRYRRGIDCSEEFLFGLIEGNVSPSPESLAKVMGQQNDHGYLPLTSYIFHGIVNVNLIKKWIYYMTDVQIKENLGHSLLHVVCESALSTEEKLRTIKYLIHKGADVNARDIFGRTPLYMAKNFRVAKMLVENGTHINSVDQCKRTPLMALLRASNPRICQYLINMGSNINSKDKFGSNALHYAAWENRIREMEILIRSGIKVDQKDRTGRTPLDIATFWRCSEAVSLLKDHERKDHRSTENEGVKRKNSEQTILWIHDLQSVLYPDYKMVKNLKGHFNIPENTEHYIQQAMKVPGIWMPNVDHEALWVESLVLSVVNTIAQRIGENDKRFKCSVFRSGSTFEDTKIDDPDEFDFLFQLDKFSDTCFVESDNEHRGFANLLSKSKTIDPDFKRYFDYENHLICGRLREDFFVLVRQVLTNRETWIYDEVFIDGINIRNIVDKPVVNFKLFITGALYKNLNISIDIVPALRVYSWWPTTANIATNEVITQSVIQEGCLLLCQEPVETLTLKWETGQSTLFRISCAPAEIKLMRSLPAWIRQSYALAKMMKGGFMCPKIKFKKPRLVSNEEVFESEYETFRTVSGGDEISSYMLKNCLFHIIASHPELLQNMPYSNQSSLYNSIALALKIYTYLGDATSKRSLPVYFLPHLNILEKEKDLGGTTFDEEEFNLQYEGDSYDEFQVIEMFCELISKLNQL